MESISQNVLESVILHWNVKRIETVSQNLFIFFLYVYAYNERDNE